MYAALAAARGQAPPSGQIPKTPEPAELIAPMYGDGPLRPTQEQIKEYYASGKGGAWDANKGAFVTSKELLSRSPPPPPPKVYDRFPPQVMPPVDIEMPRLPQVMPPMMSEPTPPPTPMPESRFRMAVEPTPPPDPYYPGNDVFRPTPPTVYDNFPPAIIDRPRDPMQPQNPPGMGGTSSAIRDLLTKQPPTKGPMPPRGMGLLEQRQPRMPEKSVMMKHGGRTAMPKGKR